METKKQRGGRRPGSGRPVGSVTKQRSAEAQKKAIETGDLPLDYLLKVMRDETVERNVRIDVAKAAAPYLHARLTTISGPGQDGAHKFEFSDHRPHLESAFLDIATRDQGVIEAGTEPPAGTKH